MGQREWTVQDVAGLLRSQARADRKSCLLIGAGASRSAGIGTSAGFVELIKKDYGEAYDRACIEAGKEPDYGACMGQLTEGERAELVHEQVGKARINWAHIGIARLEMAGYVDRILTTNFDSLASRACALFNQFPAVYDLAALRNTDGSNRARFIPAFVRGSAIYHLHGQHTGFLLLNTAKLLEQQAKRIEPALEEATAGRTVIICGYSGENDPLVDRLSRQDVYPHGLIWVCHDDKDPCPQVMQKLIRRIGDCHVVRNMPADRFFTELANALDLPQPPFLTQPFQHMLTALDQVRPFSDVTETELDLLEYARDLLISAEKGHAERAPDEGEIAGLMAKGEFEEVWDRYRSEAGERNENERDLIAWAAIMVGVAFYDQATLKQGDEADALFGQAAEKYAAALAIKPDKHEALYNWGKALTDQAKKKRGDEADVLFGQAAEKYAEALAIEPDKPEALNNWGATLADRARLKQGEEADTLLRQAAEKYEAALAIQPDYRESLNNLGGVLINLAHSAKDGEREKILNEAEQKLVSARSNRPGIAPYNLSCLAAMRGDVAAAADWLRTTKREGVLPDCAHIAADRDFDGIRHDPIFIQAFRDVGC